MFDLSLIDLPGVYGEVRACIGNVGTGSGIVSLGYISLTSNNSLYWTWCITTNISNGGTLTAWAACTERQVWNCCDWEMYQTVLCSWALFRFIIDSQFHTDVYTKCWLWMFAEHEWFPLSCCSLVFCHTIYICLTRASASVCFQKVLTGLCLIPALIGSNI